MLKVLASILLLGLVRSQGDDDGEEESAVWSVDSGENEEGIGAAIKDDDDGISLLLWSRLDRKKRVFCMQFVNQFETTDATNPAENEVDGTSYSFSDDCWSFGEPTDPDAAGYQFNMTCSRDNDDTTPFESLAFRFRTQLFAHGSDNDYVIDFDILMDGYDGFEGGDIYSTNSWVLGMDISDCTGKWSDDIFSESGDDDDDEDESAADNENDEKSAGGGYGDRLLKVVGLKSSKAKQHRHLLDSEEDDDDDGEDEDESSGKESDDGISSDDSGEADFDVAYFSVATDAVDGDGNTVSTDLYYDDTSGMLYLVLGNFGDEFFLDPYYGVSGSKLESAAPSVFVAPIFALLALVLVLFV